MGLFLSGKDLNKKRLTSPKGERNLMADWLQTWTLTSAPSWVSSRPIYPVQFGLTSLHNHISAFLVAQMEKTLPAMQETRVWCLGWEDPLEKGMATHSSILAWRIPIDRGAWWATVHGVAKNWTWLKNSSLCIMSHSKNYIYSFPTGLDGKESTCNAGALGLILGLGRSPGEGNGNSLQCSCLENPLHRGAWRFTFHGYDWATNTYMYTTSYLIHLSLSI